MVGLIFRVRSKSMVVVWIILMGDDMIDFKKIPDSDKPRERLYMHGSENLSNEELISIILKTWKVSFEQFSLRIRFKYFACCISANPNF